MGSISRSWARRVGGRVSLSALFASVLSVIAAAFALSAGTAVAATTCTGPQTPGAVLSGPLIVPAGASCILNNNTVNGSVLVQPGGHLESSRSTINGNLVANGATGTNLICGGTITGNVSITNIPTGSEFDLGNFNAPCDPLKIGGSVSLADNRGTITLVLVTVDGSMILTHNEALVFILTTVHGNLVSCANHTVVSVLLFVDGQTVVCGPH
jgi:hypothetical protein